MNGDAPAFYEHLRASTVALLGYADADNLSPAQQIRVDRAVSLRLIVDSAQAKQLRGEAIDVKAFVDASKNLEIMVGGDPETSAAHDFSGARAELSTFLAQRAAAIERRDSRLRAEIAAREEMAAVMAAAPSAPSPDNGVCRTARQTTPPDNVVPIRDPELARLGSKAVTPQSADSRAAGERAWRDSYGSDGAIVAPAWSPPDERRR